MAEGSIVLYSMRSARNPDPGARGLGEADVIVWSYGGGTQSAAIAVMILTGELPCPDIAVMADTSRECSETRQYLKLIVQPTLDTIGLTVQIVSHEYAYWDIVKEKNNSVLIPAFTRQSGNIGKLPTFCSNEWKRRPIQRWLKEQGVNTCDVWLGISTDEAERMKISDLKWYRHIYPLIEMVPTSRHQCRAKVLQYGWPEPPKSRCWMCPNMSPQSWKQLKSKWNSDFIQAVLLEYEIQKTDPTIYLHPLAIPLRDAVEQSEQQSDMFDGCDSGYCWT